MAKKILFIEDEGALQQAISFALEKEGYQTVSAMDGDAGIRLAAKEQPNLILLDLILPKKNGFDVLKTLKENPDTQRIPVMILTNLESDANIEQALAMGAASYLVKANYKIEEVIQKIKTMLGEEAKR